MADVDLMNTLTDETEIDIADIATDTGLQVRVEMDEDAVERYAERYREGYTMPPIVVMAGPAGTNTLIDGHHRLEAMRRAGLTKVRAVRQLYDDEKKTRGKRLLHALWHNARHGLPLRNRDRRKAAELVAAAFPGKSTRELAELTGGIISKSTFANILKEQREPEPMPEPASAHEHELSTVDTRAGLEPVAEAYKPAVITCCNCGVVAAAEMEHAHDSTWRRDPDGRLFCSDWCEDDNRAATEEAEPEPRTERSVVPEEPANEPPAETHKRCPFCGAEAQLYKHCGENDWFRVACPYVIWCPTAPETHWKLTEAEAWEAWNIRLAK